MPEKANRQALKVALIYVSVASAWILFSDELLNLVVRNPELRVEVSIFKGLAFVLISGGLLFLVIRRLLARWSNAVEELRRSQERYALAERAVNDGLWDWNVLTNEDVFSPRWKEIVGYQDHELPNLKSAFSDLLHPDDRELVQRVTAAHFEKGERYALEFRLRHKDGTWRWVFSRGEAVRDSAGRPVRLVGAITDITERKRSEAKLCESEERYHLLFELESDAIILADHESHRILDVNASAQKLYGYSRDEFVALRLEDVSAEPEASRLSVAADERYVPLRWHRRKSGEVFAAEITTNNFEHQGRKLKLGTIRDITSRKQAEERLRESEEKFSKIFASSPMPITLSTMNEGRYLDVNDAFLTMVQRSRDEVVGRTALEIGVWADPASRAGVIDRLKETGWVRNTEVPIRTPLGEVRHILWSAEVVVIGGERCLLGTSLDITGLKLAQQKQRESEERYRQLFELESDAIVLVDCETHRFVDVNQSAERMYGYSRDELLGMTIEAVSDEPEKSRQLVGSGSRIIPLRWHRKKSGERFALEITANVITYQGRRTELATLRDITARRHVMNMLGETTDQLLEAQRLAGLGSYTCDLTNGFWTGSQVLDEIFGVANSDLPRDEKTWLQIIHPDDRRQVQLYLEGEVLKERKPFDRIYRIIRVHDRGVRWVHRLGKLVLDEQGKAVRMVGVIQDITERKRADERMNVQVSALAAADNAIVITDQSGRIEWVNPAFSKLTGYGAEEAIGNNPRLLKSGQHPPAFYANIWSTVLTGNVWHGEIINRRKDGELYTEEMTVTPVRGTDGQIAHFVAIKQDVTEQRDLERRMQQSQKMEAIGTLAGGIAHDFNNILAAMMGFSYLLQQDTEGNTAAQENIGEILKAAGRAKDLVQQILAFSRQREQKPQIIGLDTVVKEAIKFLRASLPAQIKIEMSLDAGAPLVLADPTQIYQVTINLATNALHAMEDRPGSLTINLDRFTPDERFLQSHREFRPVVYTRLTVADTGHGMDAKTRERIFEPFFTTKPVGKGTGLGLAVVHGIVQTHSGFITVESQVGSGTTFHLYFPGRAKVPSMDQVQVSQLPEGSGQKILLLDDEPAITSSLQRLLVRLNYQVTTSNNAREVLELCRDKSKRFDLVITDLTMPEINGLEVSRELRVLRPEMPVILASGFSSDLNADNLNAAGISALLEKPISTRVLAETLRRTLAGRNGHALAK